MLRVSVLDLCRTWKFFENPWWTSNLIWFEVDPNFEKSLWGMIFKNFGEIPVRNSKSLCPWNNPLILKETRWLRHFIRARIFTHSFSIKYIQDTISVLELIKLQLYDCTVVCSRSCHQCHEQWNKTTSKSKAVAEEKKCQQIFSISIQTQILSF